MASILWTSYELVCPSSWNIHKIAIVDGFYGVCFNEESKKKNSTNNENYNKYKEKKEPRKKIIWNVRRNTKFLV